MQPQLIIAEKCTLRRNFNQWASQYRKITTVDEETLFCARWAPRSYMEAKSTHLTPLELRSQLGHDSPSVLHGYLSASAHTSCLLAQHDCLLSCSKTEIYLCVSQVHFALLHDSNDLWPIKGDDATLTAAAAQMA